MPSSTDGTFGVEEVELPQTVPEQLRVRPIAVSVCVTDLSASSRPDEFLAELSSIGATNFLFDPDEPVVFGHEFTAEVLEVGAAVVGYAVGDLIYAMPLVRDRGVLRTVGYSTRYPGALSKEVIFEAQFHITLKDGVDLVLAAMLDSTCTGIEGSCRPGDAAVVTGVGPVGLGAVVALAERGCLMARPALRPRAGPSLSGWALSRPWIPTSRIRWCVQLRRCRRSADARRRGFRCTRGPRRAGAVHALGSRSSSSWVHR